MSLGAKPPAANVDGPWQELRRERQLWRERMLVGISWSIFAGAALTSAWHITIPVGTTRLIPLLLSLTAVAGAAALGPKRGYVPRAVALLAALWGTCIYALLLAGFMPNAMIGLATTVVGATLMLGRGAGLLVVAITSPALVGVSAVHYLGIATRVTSWAYDIDSARMVVGLRVALIYGLLGATMVVGISYLLRRSEAAVVEKARSLVALSEAQREHERVAGELEIAEAAFHKASELEILGRLAGSMAHDFNNSLLVMYAALDELTSEGPLSEGMRPPVTALRAAVEQAAAVTRQLRAFGPTPRQRPTELALGPLIRKATTMLKRILPANIEFSTVVEVAETVSADEGEILRVLTNLALNARDAMRDGGKLTLRVRGVRAEEESVAPAPPGVRFVVVDVEDSGGGMTDEVKARLFEPFFTTKQGSGSGLGLASVRDVMQAHGGRVAVASKLGTGTTVSLFWPVIIQRAERPPLGATTASARGAVVLLVEDDALVRRAIKRGLEREEMTVLEAVDGASGLLTARRYAGQVDVLCTDCMMPGLPVRELIASFRESHHGRVIVCSGYAPSEAGLSPELYDDFLPKPFVGGELAERIRELLHSGDAPASEAPRLH